MWGHIDYISGTVCDIKQFRKHRVQSLHADMNNSIEAAIAIAFFGTIAFDIAIAKAIFQLLLLVLLRWSQIYFS